MRFGVYYFAEPQPADEPIPRPTGRKRSTKATHGSTR
jgi:hypothetical protein